MFWSLIGEFLHQPWTAGSTVRLMASTNPRGQPSRKQSDTSKSKRPGFNIILVLLLGLRSVPSCIKLNTHIDEIYFKSYATEFLPLDDSEHSGSCLSRPKYPEKNTVVLTDSLLATKGFNINSDYLLSKPGFGFGKSNNYFLIKLSEPVFLEK